VDSLTLRVDALTLRMDALTLRMNVLTLRVSGCSNTATKIAKTIPQSRSKQSLYSGPIYNQFIE